MRAGFICVVAQAALLLTACAPSAPSRAPQAAAPTSPTPRTPATPGLPTQSGYLTDYASLRPSPDEPGRWYALSSRIVRYHSYIVEMPILLTDTTTRGLPIDPQTGADLCAALQRELSAALAIQYQITDTPGPGVARIRTGISEIASSASRAAPDQVGGATREMEILDSLSGARLAAVVESDFESDEHASGRAATFRDTRAAFSHWSARLMLMLRDANRLATAE